MIKASLHRQKGLSLIEVLVYILVSAILLIVISQLLRTMFLLDKQLRVSHEAQQNVRLINNILVNNAHNVASIEDVRPSSEGVYFYTTPELRFALRLNNNRIEYYQQGFDQQSSQWVYMGGGPTAVTTQKAIISNWTLAPIKTASDNTWRGVMINFTLSLGDANDAFGYYQGNYQMIVSIR